MDYTCLNYLNVSESLANNLQLAEKLYFRKDHEISDNDEKESSDSDCEEDSDESCNQAEFRDCDTTTKWRELDIIQNQNGIISQRRLRMFTWHGRRKLWQPFLSGKGTESSTSLSWNVVFMYQARWKFTFQLANNKKRTRTYFTFESKIHFSVFIVKTLFVLTLLSHRHLQTSLLVSRLITSPLLVYLKMDEQPG